MVNFWSSVFVLPKSFYKRVDSLCSAFLWKNNTSSAVGARVAWKEICKPKEEGGLGIRLLEEFEIVFRLKRTWQLFANAGSLWVAWMRGNVFARKSYWKTEDAPRFSPAIRSMLQLRESVRELMRCEIGDGRFASFWFDNWTELGQLFSLFGHNGPRLLRIPLNATVSDATRQGSWHLPPARSDIAQELQIRLMDISPPDPMRGNDSFLWRGASGSFYPVFSSKQTWEQLRTTSPTVPWAYVVWFRQHVPRFSFSTWLALRNRMPTRDRLRAWSMDISASCLLCSDGI